MASTMPRVCLVMVNRIISTVTRGSQGMANHSATQLTTCQGMSGMANQMNMVVAQER